MKAIFSSLKLHEIHHLRNLLLAAGIGCRLRNEGLSTLAGEVPFAECAMQLLLEDEKDLPLAQAIILEAFSARPPCAGLWHCERCGEAMEIQFSACWKCGTERRIS